MMQVSLDGYIEGPERDLGWHRVDEELHSHFNQELRAMGAFLDGWVTYELMAGYWPTPDQDPSSAAPIVEFAGIWRRGRSGAAAVRGGAGHRARKRPVIRCPQGN